MCQAPPDERPWCMRLALKPDVEHKNPSNSPRPSCIGNFLSVLTTNLLGNMERSDCRECEDLPTLEIKRVEAGLFRQFYWFDLAAGPRPLCCVKVFQCLFQMPWSFHELKEGKLAFDAMQLLKKNPTECQPDLLSKHFIAMKASNAAQDSMPRACHRELDSLKYPILSVLRKGTDFLQTQWVWTSTSCHHGLPPHRLCFWFLAKGPWTPPF